MGSLLRTELGPLLGIEENSTIETELDVGLGAKVRKVLGASNGCIEDAPMGRLGEIKLDEVW